MFFFNNNSSCSCNRNQNRVCVQCRPVNHCGKCKPDCGCARHNNDNNCGCNRHNDNNCCCHREERRPEIRQCCCCCRCMQDMRGDDNDNCDY